MLESSYFGHVLSFRELIGGPPGELIGCPRFAGAFSHYKNRFLGGEFCFKFWSQLVFLCFRFVLN